MFIRIHINGIKQKITEKLNRIKQTKLHVVNKIGSLFYLKKMFWVNLFTRSNFQCHFFT